MADLRAISRRRGILVPFARNRINDFANGDGAALIRSNLEVLLGARGDSDYTQGEYPWRTEFGSLLDMLRHDNRADITNELAFIYVGDAVNRWMPRIRVTQVEFLESTTIDEGTVHVLRVWYVPRDSSLRTEGDLFVDVSLPTSS